MIHQKLENGCNITVHKNAHSKLAAIQVWIHAGSIHENEKQYGMAHLIEHMLFKGTNKRGVGEISREVEACGGDINAYTTFDRTVYYLTLDVEDLEKGIDILSDAVLESQFDAEELEKEKEVVVEEIRRGLDSPSNQVGRKLFDQTYPNGPMGRPIIGFEDGVKSFSRDDLLGFYNRWYQPENMNVVIVGDFDEATVVSLSEKYFGQKASAFEGRLASFNDAFPSDPEVHLIKADYKQPRLQLAFPGAHVNERDAIYLDLAAYALGVGDLSRLNTTVRDEKQLVTAVGSSLYAPSFKGLFTVSAFPVAEKYLEAVESIGETVQRFVLDEPVTEEELSRAKAHLKMQKILEDETVEGIARNIGFSLTTDQSLHFEEYYYKVIDEASVEDVMGTIWRYMKAHKYVLIGMLPEGHELTEDEVKAALKKNLQFSRAPAVLKQQGQERSKASENSVQTMDLKPGLKLVYRQKKDSQLLSMVLASEGGSRAESTEQAGVYHCMSSLFAKASEKKPYPDFAIGIENVGATMDGFSGKDSYGLTLQGLSEHRETLLSHLQEALFAPNFTDMHWAITLQQIEQTVASENDQPSRIAIRELKKLLYGNHPYRRPVYGELDVVRDFSPSALLEEYKKLRDQGPWVIGAVSDLSLEDFAAQLKPITDHWNPAQEAPTFKQAEEAAGFVPSAHIERIPKDREQTHIVIGYRGLQWDDSDREKLDALSSILGGMGGRLFTRLRDQNSLAYTVAPMTAHGFHPGIFGCYIACAPDKTDQALTQLQEELGKITEEVCSEEELERSKRYILGSHESEYQQSDSQAMTMALMELFGLGADDYLQYRSRLQKVKPKDVQEVARRLFQSDHLVQVIVGN